MAGSFRDRAFKATKEKPCPICGRPSGNDPRSAGKCLVSRDGEHVDSQGRTWHDPEGAAVHCFRIYVARIGPYVLQDQQIDKHRQGAFYVDEDAGELVLDAEGKPPGGRPGKKPRRKPRVTTPAAPVWINRFENPPGPLSLTDAESRMRRMATQLWHESSGQNDHAIAYLSARGIDRGWLESNWPESLAWHGAVYHKDSDAHLPAMLGRVTAPTGEHVATHRIYLQQDGRGKADVEVNKLTIGPLCGGAIRLYDVAKTPLPSPLPGGEREQETSGSKPPPRSDEGTLCIAEGIETAMAAASAVVQMGWGVWSCLSTGGMRSLVLPHEMIGPDAGAGRIRRVVLLADVDRSKLMPSPAEPSQVFQQGLGGQRAARATAERLRNEYPGLGVAIAWPGSGRLVGFDRSVGEVVPGGNG